MSKGEDRLAGRYNSHSPSVQRILKEIKEIHKSPSSLFTAAPLEVDLNHSFLSEFKDFLRHLSPAVYHLSIAHV